MNVGLAGLGNAQVNCWPMILISGSSDTTQEDMGGFQEFRQIEACRQYTKFAARPGSIEQIPFVVEKAFRTSMYGRPGPCYIDLPGDFIQGTVSGKVAIHRQIPEAPKYQADTRDVERAIEVLKTAKNPLIIVGKGAAYAKSEHEVNHLIESVGFPFLPTPMGKGVVSDTHPLCVAAARSKALAKADAIVLLGARLNWILHFGMAPRIHKDCKIIQVDICPEEISNNRETLPLVGDISLVVRQLTEGLKGYQYSQNSPFLKELKAKIQANTESNEKRYKDDSIPMSYHRVFSEIKQRLPEDVMIVSEGANTMDIARTVFDMYTPRLRLDAGTFATMGVGMGFSIAAQVFHPNKKVVAIVGDSAFGFSAMELETAARAKLPLIIIVVNNNGIYHGLDDGEFSKTAFEKLPPTALLPETRYDMIAEAVGGKGYFVRTPEELGKAVNQALEEKETVSVINVMIKPGGKKKLEFGWMSNPEPKL
ncbi:hypothetical protein K7432_000270 [Basidiobolus ranarum]|uniref:2-hydroxyacyl-CoA lyase n=1 Tax=Basidiobolus ranarum TaxID=34480 RepID=A0ABR2WBE6_9FUNG